MTTENEKCTVCRCGPIAGRPGFVRYPHLVATLEASADIVGVTPRTIRYWLEREHPLPAIYRDDEGKSPLLSISTLMLWIALQRVRNPSFGLHGGDRT